jgi:putative ABC transport system permease protein
MLRNIFKISFRIFIKERFYTFTNVFGLAIGIASAFLIAQYIFVELSYDKHHPDVDITYRVNQTNFWSPDGGIMGSTVLPLAEALKSEFPEVISTMRINTPGSQYISSSAGTETFLEGNILGADSSFFDFFEYNFQYGDPSTALDKTNTAVLTHDIAIKYFGTDDVLGKTLLMGDDKQPIIITGVLSKDQKNTHFDFDILFSIYTNPDVKRFEWSWIWTQAVTYVKVERDISPMQKRMNEVADKYAKGAFSRLGIDLSEFEKEKGEITFFLQPVKDIHLYSAGIHNRIGVDGNITYIYIFTIVAIFVLLLACINFINLATARAVKRFKEIGVRKVLGSTKKQLVFQILLESFFISVVATILGLGLSELMRIGLNISIGITFDSNIWDYPMFYLGLSALPILLGLFAGIYPAFYLTSQNPVDILKGRKSKGKESVAFRNALVIFQFTIAIALMIATLLISQQLDFFQNGNMGFKRDNILVIEDTEVLGESQDVFKNEAGQLSNVEQLAITSVVPSMGSMEDVFYSPSDPEKKITLGTIKVDNHYLELLEIDLLAGRNFSEMQSEKNNVIINEMTMRQFGWDLEKAIGQKIEYFESVYEVIGVTKDFHSLPFYYPIAPVILFDLEAQMFNASKHMLLTIDMKDKKQIIETLKAKWKQVNPDAPFNYSYLDESIALIYENEDNLSKLFSVFTSLAMIIALIGLIGMAAFITTQRVKELGVRKVLGASVSQLVFMVNSKFSFLVFISCLLAMPLAYYAVSKWLEQFQYRIEIGFSAFVYTLIIVMLVTWITVSFHSIKSALINPVDSLKDE